jgi:hypothetical protein
MARGPLVGLVVLIVSAVLVGTPVAGARTTGVKCPSGTEFASTLKLKVLTATQAPTFDGATECVYETTGEVAQAIWIYTGKNSAALAKAESSYKGSPNLKQHLSGIGNAAFAVSVKIQTWTTNLYFLKGSTEVDINVSATLANTEALAKKIAASL